MRRLEPAGIRAAAGKFVTDAFGVDTRESEDERGWILGRGGSGPGPWAGLRCAGEYGRDCGGGV